MMSNFGAMFTPEPQRAVAELLRVCRPGGRIGLTNWTPDSFVGQIFRLVSSYVPPPAGVPSPLEWGTKACVGALLGTEVASIGIRDSNGICWRWPPLTTPLLPGPCVSRMVTSRWCWRSRTSRKESAVELSGLRVRPPGRRRWPVSLANGRRAFP